MKKLLSLILVAVMLLTAVPLAFAEGNTYKVGDIIQFGSYPQSEVKDETLIAELNALAPEWEDWTSYGYYSGTGDYGTMVQGDWMRYTDIVYGGVKYRGVTFTQYRPSTTSNRSLSSTYQYYNGYYTNTVYWFKFEPIDWRVLDPSTGLVICETIIDSQPYTNTIYNNGEGYEFGFFNDSMYYNYACDYETSSIRKWLNNDFYNVAFSESEKKEINPTKIENVGYYSSIGLGGYENFNSKETHDKIFLLSYKEIGDTIYGFNSSQYVADEARRAIGSDYAKCQGLSVYNNSLYQGTSYWLLRSAGNYSTHCCGVRESGTFYNYASVDDSSFGIRPVLRFCKHNYKTVATDPTCTTQGYTTYTCECGDTYVGDYVDARGHDMGEYLVITKPTCTSKGVEISFCSRCDHAVRKDIAMLHHIFTNYISDGKATCTTDGLLIAKCDNCDATDTKPEKGTHKFSDSFTIDLDPTCTTDGQKSRHCLNCTEKTDITPIGKLAHTYNTITIDPACTDRGHKIYTCPCGDSYTETLPALGHNFSGSVCTTCGYDKADDCTCNCHKTGLSALIWKILNFFYRLLRLNPTCNCGIAHY